MTDTTLKNWLEEALEHLDILRISHPDVEFDETTTTTLDVVPLGETFDTLRKGYDTFKQLPQLLQQIKTKSQKKPTLDERLRSKGYQNLEVIQPPVKQDSYKNGYFISKPVGRVTIPGCAMVDEDGRLRIYISGSANKEEAKQAVTTQAEVLEAIKPFLIACVEYAKENKLTEIVVAGDSRGATAVVNAGAIFLVDLCRVNNIKIKFFPIAAFEPDVRMKKQFMPGATYLILAGSLRTEVANNRKNFISNIFLSTGDNIPRLNICSQYGNEKLNDLDDFNYENLKTYATNLNTSMNDHGVASYVRTLTELKKNPIYGLVLDQIEEQPCELHYVKEDAKLTLPVTLQADSNNPNVILPFWGDLEIKSAKQKSYIFYFDHPNAAERIIFDPKDDIRVVVKGNSYQFLITPDVENPSEIVVSNKDTGKIIGTFVNPDQIFFDNCCAQWSNNKLTFNDLDGNITTQIASCVNPLNLALGEKKVSLRQPILVKH